MARLGIETGADLKARDLAFLQQHFGKSGPWFYWVARGIDDTPGRRVKPLPDRRDGLARNADIGHPAVGQRSAFDDQIKTHLSPF